MKNQLKEDIDYDTHWDSDKICDRICSAVEILNKVAPFLLEHAKAPQREVQGPRRP